MTIFYLMLAFSGKKKLVKNMHGRTVALELYMKSSAVGIAKFSKCDREEAVNG